MPHVMHVIQARVCVHAIVVAMPCALTRLAFTHAWAACTYCDAVCLPQALDTTTLEPVDPSAPVIGVHALGGLPQLPGSDMQCTIACTYALQ